MNTLTATARRSCRSLGPLEMLDQDQEPGKPGHAADRGRHVLMTKLACIIAALACGIGSAHAQTKQEWSELGTRIRGGFGVLIPVGIHGNYLVPTIPPRGSHRRSVRRFRGAKRQGIGDP